MSDPFYPLQTPENLPAGVSFGYENDEHFFRFIGRGGNAVPEFGLTQQQALPMGRTQAMLVRFRCRSSLGINGTLQGIAVRLQVITRAGDGTSEDPKLLYDSAPFNDQTGEVFYRETHDDIRTVTRIIQMPGEVVGGTHVVVWILTRGTGGYADIFPGVEVRNHYQRVHTYRLGSSTETNFPWTDTSGLYNGRLPFTRARSFAPTFSVIAEGQPVTITADVMIVFAQATTALGSGKDFRFGIALRAKRRSDLGYDWLGGKALRPPENTVRIEEELLSFSVTTITEKAYIEIQPIFFFALVAEDDNLTLDQQGILIRVQIDDSVLSGAT